MKFEDVNITCNDDKSYNRLIHFMMKISAYRNFDEEMLCNVYVDRDDDLVGFESQKYRIQWVNNAHKIKDINLKSLQIEPVPFSILKSKMLSIG